MSNFPPDGYEMSFGTWNTDAQEDNTTYLSGNSSVEFIQGTALTSMIAQEYTPVAVTRERLWQVSALIQQYGGTGGTLTIGARMYDQNKVFARNSTNAFVIAAAGAWTNISNISSVQAGEMYMRPYIVKDATNVGYYIDRLWSTPVPGLAWTYPAGAWNQIIASGAGWTTITGWNAIQTSSTGFSYAAGVISPMYSGVANIHATVCWDQAYAAIGDYYEMRIEWIDPFLGALQRFYANTTPLASVPAAGLPIRQTVSASVYVEPTAAIKVQVRQQTGTNRNIICAANPSFDDWSSFHVAMHN